MTQSRCNMGTEKKSGGEQGKVYIETDDRDQTNETGTKEYVKDYIKGTSLGTRG